MPRLTQFADFGMVLVRSRPGCRLKRRAVRSSTSSRTAHKSLSKKGLSVSSKAKALPPDPDAPAKQQQLKSYEEALKHFQQQKFPPAQEALERVLTGPSK